MRSSVPSAESTMIGTSLHWRMPPAHLHAVEVGQPEVEDDDVGRADGGLGDALLPGGGHQHVVPERAQADAQDAQQGLVVVDGEDGGHSGHRPR